MSADLDVSRIRQLAEQATPGPWDYTPNPSRVVTANPYRTSVTACYNHGDEQDDANAAFIAAVSPDVVLQLLDRIEVLAEDRAHWVDALGAAEAERDRLHRQVQAVREAWDNAVWCDYGDHTGMTWQDSNELNEAMDAALAAGDGEGEQQR